MPKSLQSLLPNSTAEERSALAIMQPRTKRRLVKELACVLAADAQCEPLRIRILQCAGLPAEVKSQLCRDLALEDKDSNYRVYAELLMRLPREPRVVEQTRHARCKMLVEARRKMDEAVHGQVALKDTLMQAISQRLCCPDAAPMAIGIQGPAGNGKTTLLRHGVAEALDIPFHTVSLGGLSDSSHLLGFDRTYQNARHGRLAEIALQSQCTNPIIFFDELDKVSTSGGNDVTNVLIHLTDPESSGSIHDKFLGPIDLSGATLVFAYNDASLVHPVLMNRLRNVETKGYSQSEKLEIAKQHLWPRAVDKSACGDVACDEAVLAEVVRRCDHEEGVRQLQQSVASIVQRANTCIATSGKVSLGVPPECYSIDGSVSLTMPEATTLLDAVLPASTCGSRPPCAMYT